MGNGAKSKGGELLAAHSVLQCAARTVQLKNRKIASLTPILPVPVSLQCRTVISGSKSHVPLAV